MAKIQGLLQNRLRKAESLARPLDSSGDNLYLESVDKMFLLHHLCMQEVVYMCEMVQQPEIGESVRAIFGGLRYVFEMLTNSYVQKVEMVQQLHNSTRVRYIEKEDRPVRLEMMVEEMDALRNKRAEELAQEDTVRQQAKMLSDDVKVSLGDMESLMNSIKGFNMNFADVDEIAAEEAKEKKRIKDAVRDLRSMMEKGIKIDYKSIPDPKIIVEFHNQVYEQMIYESRTQQQNLTTAIMDVDGMAEVDLKTPGALHRLVLMNTRIVESLDLVRFESMIPTNWEDPGAIFKSNELELFKTLSDKQRDLMAKVVHIVKRSFEKPKSNKVTSTVMTSKDLEAMSYKAMSTGGNKELKNELANTKAEVDELKKNLDKAKEQIIGLETTIESKDNLIMALTNNVDLLKRIQSAKAANREEIDSEFFAKNTNTVHLEEKIKENETEKDDVTEKLNKLVFELGYKSKELDIVRRKLITMKEALESVKILITNHEKFKVGTLTDLEVIQKIEVLLHNLEEKVKEQEAELHKNVPVNHVEFDARTHPGKIFFQDDQGSEEREFYVSNSLTHQIERTLNTPGENRSGLKVTIISIAVINPNKKKESTIPASMAGRAGSTKNLAGLKSGQLKDAMTRIKGGKADKKSKLRNDTLNNIQLPNNRDSAPAANYLNGTTAKKTNKKTHLPSDQTKTLSKVSSFKQVNGPFTGDQSPKVGSQSTREKKTVTRIDLNVAGNDMSVKDSRTQGLSPGRSVEENSNQLQRLTMEPTINSATKHEKSLDFTELERIMVYLGEGNEAVLVKCLINKFKVSIIYDEGIFQFKERDFPTLSRSNSNNHLVSKDTFERKILHQSNGSGLPTIKESNNQLLAFMKQGETRAINKNMKGDERVFASNSKRFMESVLSHRNSMADSVPTTLPLHHIQSTEVERVLMRVKSVAIESQSKHEPSMSRIVKYLDTEGSENRNLAMQHRRNISTHVHPHLDEDRLSIRLTRSQRWVSVNGMQLENDKQASSKAMLLKKKKNIASLVSPRNSLGQRNTPTKSIPLSEDHIVDDGVQLNASVLSNSQQGNLPVEYQVYVPAKSTRVPDHMNVLVNERFTDESFLEQLYSGLMRPSSDANLNFEAVGHHLSIPTLHQFKKAVKVFAEKHSGCGPSCPHLQRFYERCGVKFQPRAIPVNKQPYIFPTLDLIKKVPETDLSRQVSMTDHARRKADLLRQLSKKPVFI